MLGRRGLLRELLGGLSWEGRLILILQRLASLLLRLLGKTTLVAGRRLWPGLFPRGDR